MAALGDAGVRLSLLGKFALTRGGEELVLPGLKLRALLAFLACSAGKPQSRDRLIGLLWGERFEAQARQSLRHALCELRRQLGGVLQADRDVVRLDQAFSSDVSRFLALISTGDRASLGQAIDLYEDDLLAGFGLPEKGFSDWLTSERARLRDLAVGALEILMDGSALKASAVDLIRYARRAIALDPYRERAHRQLLSALAATGHRNEALVHFRRLEHLLRDELGVQPESETRQLFEALRAGVRAAAAPNRDQPSIAVLPFVNMSVDPLQDYLADGMTEDLITDLAKVSSLFVICRNSSFVYKGKAIEPAEAAKELGVRYLLKGSVRRQGDQVRINAHLIDTATGDHLWAERYDRTMSDVFALQDDIARDIVAALQVELSKSDWSRIARPESDDVRAYDAFLQGWERYRRNAPLDHAAAIPYFEQAIALDPGYGRAHAALALVYYDIADFGWSDQLGFTKTLVLTQSRQHLDQALQHPTSTAHLLQGEWLRVAGRFDEAIVESERAVALDPSDSLALANLSNILSSAGRARDGLDAINSAMRIDPHYPALYLHYLAKAQFGLGRFSEAAASWEREAKRSPKSTWGFVFLASAYGHLGRISDAKTAIANADSGFAGRARTTVLLASVVPYKDRNDLERFLDGLRKAGVPELPFGYTERTSDRLSGDAIRVLLFGHTTRGHDADGKAFTVTRTADGVVTKTLPAGSQTGQSIIEGDRLCDLYPLSGRSCTAVFHNPTGTLAQWNQYIFVSPWHETMVSIIE